MMLIRHVMRVQGKISAADIQQIAKELGENFTAREIQEMIEEADRDRKFFFPHSSSEFVILVLLMNFITLLSMSRSL